MGSEAGGCQGDRSGWKEDAESWIWGEARGPEEKTRVRGAWGRRGGDVAPRGDGEHGTLGLEDT